MKLKAIIIICILAVATLLVFNFAAPGSQPALSVTVDNVNYQLNQDWSYDEENRTFINDNLPNVRYTLVPLKDCDMKSLEERRATFSKDGSDGIDTEIIDIAGHDALLTHEPVNELDDYNIYFYLNSHEHIINFETAFGDKGHQPYTQELIEGIQQ